MKIRRRILLFGLVMIGIVVLLIWFKFPSLSPPPRKGATKSIPEESESNHVVRNRAAPPDVANPSAPTQTATASTPTPRFDDKADQMRELIPSINVPIVFYGKLEDQFDNPVAGAQISGNVTVFDGYAGKQKKIVATSDANGLFKLDGGRGQMLGIIPRKAGYAIASTSAGGDYSENPEKQHPDPNNPVIIKMWKLQGSEPLLRINQSYRLHYTGEAIYFDLIQGKVVPNGGDVKITVSRATGNISERNEQDWAMKIEAVNGGVMETTVGQERVTYWAPENGYEPTLSSILSTNPPNKWSEALNLGLFMRSRGGEVYSKLKFFFRINQEPTDLMYFNFQGIANTNSSRNWEADPNAYKP